VPQRGNSHSLAIRQLTTAVLSAVWLCATLCVRSIAAQQVSPAHAQGLPPQASGYRLVFFDDFHSLDLSPDGRGNHTWYNGVWFRHDLPPNSSIDTSQTYLSLRWKRNGGPPETSITTLSRDARFFRAWRYGYFEARMKWRAVRGSWPAFWLIPVQDAARTDLYQGIREAGEIDIFEGQGDHPHDYYATIHDWVGGNDLHNNGNNNRFPLPRRVDYSQWHDYGLLWVPGKVTWYFDGLPMHSEPTYGIFDKQDYYLAFTEQVGSDWTYGSTSGMDVNDLSLDVQWVEVWQLP
jgi:beta-glucanase (GH16 family)